jgi:hypothetical protein
MEKEYRHLQERFDHAADAEESDVYKYRIINEDRPAIAALADAWKSFQELFSVAYSSVKSTGYSAGNSGNKSRRAKGKEADRHGVPEFAYGYSFDGSIGVALTLPRKVALVEDPAIDEATQMIFRVARAHLNREPLGTVARHIGPAAVSALYEWADIHAGNHFGAGIEWRRGNEIKGSITVGRNQFETLRDELSQITIETKLTVDGELKAVDMDSSKFRIRSDSGEEFEGYFGEAITSEHRATLPARYSATITRSTKVVPVEVEEEPSYTLISLISL